MRGDFVPVQAQEIESASRRFGKQIPFGKGGHFEVVFALRSIVGSSCRAESPDVSGKFGTDVEKFVKDRHELFVETLIQKPWDVQRQDIVQFDLPDEEPLHLVEMPAAYFAQDAIAKSQRRQFGLIAPGPFAATPGQGQKDSSHIHMSKFIDPSTNVGRQCGDVPGVLQKSRIVWKNEIGPERLLHVGVSRPRETNDFGRVGIE